MAEEICPYYKSGYCKFGNACKNRHISEVCDRENCEQNACILRHPKQCRYFSTNGFCKFGIFCAFAHNIIYQPNKKLENLIKETREKVDTIENTLKEFDKRLKLVLDLGNMEDCSPSGRQMVCDQCGLVSENGQVHREGIYFETLRGDNLVTDTSVNIENVRQDPIFAPNIIGELDKLPIEQLESDDSVSSLLEDCTSPSSYTNHQVLQAHIVEENKEYAETTLTEYYMKDLVSDFSAKDLVYIESESGKLYEGTDHFYIEHMKSAMVYPDPIYIVVCIVFFIYFIILLYAKKYI